jgi:hypothetical protein
MNSPPDRLTVRLQSDPLSVELSQRHFDAECAFIAALARFQALGATVPDLTLASVVKAAQPAFADGFCYLVRQDEQSIEVSLRHSGGAEEVSFADAEALVSPALLLAGLLGIPVDLDGQAPESGEHTAQPEPVQSEPNADDALAQDSQEPVTGIPVSEPEPDLMGPDSPADLPGDHPILRALTPEEIEAAVAMVKQMQPAQRKAFTIAFRCAFNVDDTVTRIATTITQVRHLQFIDRFTVEAAGGIAP